MLQPMRLWHRSMLHTCFLPESKLSHSVKSPQFTFSISLQTHGLTATYLLSRHFASVFQTPYLATVLFHEQVRKQRSPVAVAPLPVDSRVSTPRLPSELFFFFFLLIEAGAQTQLLFCQSSEQSVQVLQYVCSTACRGQFGSKFKGRLKTSVFLKKDSFPLVYGSWKLGVKL